MSKLFAPLLAGQSKLFRPLPRQYLMQDACQMEEVLEIETDPLLYAGKGHISGSGSASGSSRISTSDWDNRSTVSTSSVGTVFSRDREPHTLSTKDLRVQPSFHTPSRDPYFKQVLQRPLYLIFQCLNAPPVPPPRLRSRVVVSQLSPTPPLHPLGNDLPPLLAAAMSATLTTPPLTQPSNRSLSFLFPLHLSPT